MSTTQSPALPIRDSNPVCSGEDPALAADDRQPVPPVKPDKGRVLIIVENLPVPFDRRVWLEATTLHKAGYTVSVICPKAPGYEASEETIDGVHIYRHHLPLEARSAAAYLIEYAAALFWQTVLSFKVFHNRRFDVVHICNPPDLLFIVALLHKIIGGRKIIFDHHDAAPELYEAKFGRRDLYWQLLTVAEKCTFWTADISIATNESYRRIAINRGAMKPDRVFVVRSGPSLDRFIAMPADPTWRHGRRFMVGYVGVISRLEGLDLLLAAVDHIVRTRRRTDVQFVVVGSGPEWQSIVRMAIEMDLREYVTFTGRVDDATLFTILSTADLCVNPDRVTPMTDISTMNKIMEYMAFAKPIVQFDVTEGRFSASKSSLYARTNDPLDFGEKILTLIDDEQLRATMGAFGLQRVRESLAWHHEEPQLLGAYEALFALHRRRSRWLKRLSTLVPWQMDSAKP
jgi:glycosyltransferase involved in cell wall biosynthesis